MKNNIPEELLPLIDWWEENGKQTLVMVLVGIVAVAGYYGVKQWRAGRRSAAASVLTGAYTSAELEDGAAKYSSAAAGPAIRLRLAKKYYDEERYEEALSIYSDLEGKAPNGFEDVPALGRAQCLEALEKYDEAIKAYDSFAEAKADSYLNLSARLGAVRVLAATGEKNAALARLDAMKEAMKDDEEAVAKIESVKDLVTRWEKREKRSLFDAADAAAKEIANESVVAKPAEEKPAETKAAESKEK